MKIMSIFALYYWWSINTLENIFIILSGRNSTSKLMGFFYLKKNIMETKDYLKFKLLKENRKISDSTIKKIVQSVKEWGIIPGRPILIDEHFNIVDGQHRYYAYRSLDLPIPYEIIKGDVIAKTMALNSNQQHWKLIDYIESYSNQGIDCYRKILKFEEKYKFGLSSNLSITVQDKIKSNNIKKGVVFDLCQDYELIGDYIESLNMVSFYKSQHFVRAVVFLFKKADKKQLDIIRTNILRVPKGGTMSDYITSFENIINFKKRGRNIIKL